MRLRRPSVTSRQGIPPASDRDRSADSPGQTPGLFAFRGSNDSHSRVVGPACQRWPPMNRRSLAAPYEGVVDRENPLPYAPSCGMCGGLRSEAERFWGVRISLDDTVGTSYLALECHHEADIEQKGHLRQAFGRGLLHLLALRRWINQDTLRGPRPGGSQGAGEEGYMRCLGTSMTSKPAASIRLSHSGLSSILGDRYTNDPGPADNDARHPLKLLQEIEGYRELQAKLRIDSGYDREPPLHRSGFPQQDRRLVSRTCITSFQGVVLSGPLLGQRHGCSICTVNKAEFSCKGKLCHGGLSLVGLCCLHWVGPECIYLV